MGDTPKEQWLNAINMCSLAIEINIDNARSHLMEEYNEDNGGVEACDAAKRVLHDFTDEMRRLVEGVFDD